VIDARIGARVRQEHEPIVDGHRYTVSHKEKYPQKTTERRYCNAAHMRLTPFYGRRAPNLNGYAG
jgi:hypothetical protein